MKRIFLGWSSIMAFYAMKKMEENKNHRYYKFYEIDDFVTDLAQYAEETHQYFRLDESISGLPNDVVDYYSDIFEFFTFNDGCKGFSVKEKISDGGLYLIFLSSLSFDALSFLDLAYKNLIKI